MACFQQYQLCDGSESRCGPLSSWMDAQTGAAELFGTTAEALVNNESPPADNPSASRYICLWRSCRSLFLALNSFLTISEKMQWSRHRV